MQTNRIVSRRRYSFQITIMVVLNLLACTGDVSTKQQHNRELLQQSVKQASSKPHETFVLGRITNTTPGNDVRGSKTIFVTIDKGTRDGIATGHVGFVRVHAATINELRAIEVAHDSTVLQGWYYANIHVNQLVVVTIRDVSSEAAFAYFEQKGIKAPVWKED